MRDLLRLALLTLLAALPAAAQEGSPPATAEQGQAATAPAEAEAPQWPWSRSDIPVHARLRLGRLSNGMGYVWAPNREPRERSYLRLRIDAGSLHETDAERGMAHFLEHMAFNGTERFPAGTLVEWFQRHGMAFGADSNAYTGFGETVYELDLPHSDAQTLREALAVLRDFAGKITIEPEEVEREKGVIDGEERERDSAAWRVLLAQMDVMYVGTRYPARLPIGTREARAAFTAEMVRAFYERWYRPETMTLVLVGDLGELDPVPLFEEAFADFAPPELPVPPEPPIGEPEGYAFAFAVPERELPTVRLHLERLRPFEPDPLTRAHWLSELPLQTARAMLNLRFSELVKQEGAPFLSAGAGSAEALEAFDGEQLVVTCAPDRWREALAAGEQELRRALAHGFGAPELEEVRADWRRALQEAVEREPTRSSASLVAEVLGALEGPAVPTDAATDLAILGPALEALTLEQCDAALREAWGDGATTIYAVGDLDLGAQPGDALAAALAESRAVEVEAPPEIAGAEFAYAAEGEPGAIAERAHVEDLDAHLVRFANGVLLNVKRTDFQQNQVLVRARLAEGRLTLPVEPAPQAMPMVAQSAFEPGGLEAHDADALRRLLAGRQVSLGFGVAPDHFALGGATTAEDLQLQLELLAAYLEHPGWRPDGLRVFKRQLPQFFEQLRHSHEGPLIREFLPGLQEHDPRSGLPDRELLDAVTVEALRDWLAPHLAEGPLEVSIVGDVDVEQAIAAAARTLGRLPQRRAARLYEERRSAPAPAAGESAAYEVDTRIPKTLVFLVFPTTDGIAPERRWNLAFLARVLDDRLRVEVRERLGAAYSPSARSEPGRVHPGVGMLLVSAMADPDKAGELLEACLQAAQDLAEEGLDADELARLREPLLKQLRDSARRNGYWLEVLDEAQSLPATLDEHRTVLEHHLALEPETVAALAALYLRRERASSAVVAPAAAAPTEASGPAPGSDENDEDG